MGHIIFIYKVYLLEGKYVVLYRIRDFFEARNRLDID